MHIQGFHANYVDFWIKFEIELILVEYSAQIKIYSGQFNYCNLASGSEFEFEFSIQFQFYSVPISI